MNARLSQSTHIQLRTWSPLTSMIISQCSLTHIAFCCLIFYVMCFLESFCSQVFLRRLLCLLPPHWLMQPLIPPLTLTTNIISKKRLLKWPNTSQIISRRHWACNITRSHTHQYMHPIHHWLHPLTSSTCVSWSNHTSFNIILPCKHANNALTPPQIHSHSSILHVMNESCPAATSKLKQWVKSPLPSHCAY